MALFSLVGQRKKKTNTFINGNIIYMCGYVNIFKNSISSLENGCIAEDLQESK